ncbi:MAG TPA: acyl-CoA dehydrogenase, partial [Rhizomicrobium sp.]
MTYRAPDKDIAFALDIAGIERVLRLDKFASVDRDTVDAVIDGAGRFAEGVLAPLNRSGDVEGARFEKGRVFAARGFADAYKQYAQGGWNSLTAEEAFGGQGLPRAVGLAAFECMTGANMSFGLCPLLTEAAIHCLETYGDSRQKSVFLPKLVSGEWTGTMNLTESQAGSDLSLVRTRAEPSGSGYKLFGQKIFITWGDHDCADNIVHLVLARLPDAPAGVKGISLFLAPKNLVDANGKIGAANALKPVSIEHKLGIHASPTCVMAYEGADAEIVGQPGNGLAQMFTMMNAARLGVGMEGVAIAEAAYQQALAFSRERRQGRSPWSSDPTARIFDQPDVRRMLMLMKAKTDAARMICLSTAVAADLASNDDDARLREELLVPIAKAWSTDVGVEVVSLGVQVHGGMGFIEETGAAQHYRDARIAPIYEGTNGIQAIDLVGRKLAMADGAPMTTLVHDIRQTAETLVESPDPRLHTIGMRLQAAGDALRSAAEWLSARRSDVDGLAGATPFLKLMGDVTGGWLLGKGALSCVGRSAADPYARARIGIAGHYAETLLA